MGAAERLSRASGNGGSAHDHGDWESEPGEELDRWCAEVDGQLVCLSTRQVWTALAQGRLRPETPVWRDGRGHWTPILDVPELTDDGDEARISVPERSEIRPRRRHPVEGEGGGRAGVARGGVADRRGVGAATLALLRTGPSVLRALRARLIAAMCRAWSKRFSVLKARALRRTATVCLFVAGLALAAVAWVRLPASVAVPVPRAQRVAVDVAERARLVAARVGQRSLQRERDWWAQRWR